MRFYDHRANLCAWSRIATGDAVSIAVLAMILFTPGALLAQTVTLSPTPVSVLGGGGPQTVTVSAPSGLAWTASTTASWISFPSGNTGTGNGTLVLQIAANTTSQEQDGTVTFTYSGGSASLPVSEAGLVAAAPTITLLNQSLSNLPQQTISIKISDPNGTAYVPAIEILVDNQIGQYYGCEFYYWAGELNLIPNGNVGAWTPLTFAPGQGVVSGTNCSIDQGNSSISSDQTSITFNLAITLQPSAVGTQTISAGAWDANNNPSSQNFNILGTWTGIAEISTAAPVVSMDPAPSATSASGQLLHYELTDNNGYTYLSSAGGQIGTSQSNPACLFIFNYPNFVRVYTAGYATLLGEGTLGGGYSYPQTNGIIGGNGACFVDLNQSRVYTSTDGTYTMQDPNVGFPHTNLYLDLFTSLDSTVLQTLPLNLYLDTTDLAGRDAGTPVVGTWSAAPQPTITSLSPNSAPATTLVIINGSNFGATQGTSTVTFNGTSAGVILTWSNTLIRVAVPSGATTGNVVVTVNGVASTGSSAFAVTNSPIVSYFSPSSAPAGVSVTIYGFNFGATQGNSTVTVNGILATASAWSNTSISAIVPSGASTGSVIVTVGGSSNAGTTFSVPPVLNSVSPTAGVAGTQITLSGSGFGSTQSAGTVWLGTTYGIVVSWSDTQIVATIASNSSSGTARVQRSGTWSGTVPLAVNTATISNVTPTSGLPSTQVTITGTGFGAQQGSGQVWLGTAVGIVQSWNDAQVVAQVASGSASGNALIIQNGVTSNSVPFTVSSPQITSISPTSGPVGASVTISGSGFGTTQASGGVQLGSMNGQVVSWNDSQVVATVAASSLSGIVRVTQNAIQSNSKSFIVTGSGGSTLTLTPVMLNMMLGDTHTIQALNSSNQPVIGLTWASSDPTIVSLSTDDPPVLTALAAGHVTITAGSASADVTVSSVALALGSVLWSNPINGASVDSIVPAVPSPTGVADVFAQSDSTVYAITSDGATAWTADLSDFEYPVLYPDFQGGVVAADQHKVAKLDGLTGQRYAAYTAPEICILHDIAVHTDGIIFVNQEACNSAANVSLIGVDPTTGTAKFQVPVPYSGNSGGLIIAGDGFAYLPYGNGSLTGSGMPNPQYYEQRWGLLRVSSSGTSADFTLEDWYETSYYESNCQCYSALHGPSFPSIITNADTGVMAAWYEHPTGTDYALRLANVTANGVSITSGPNLPVSYASVKLDLQAQDGSFIGEAGTYGTGRYTFSADAGGNFRWVTSNVVPSMATADGGFIGQNIGSNQVLTYDQYGNATGKATIQSEPGWLGNVLGYSYSMSGGDISNISSPSAVYATTFAALQGGNASHQGTAIQQVATKLPQGPAKQLPDLSSPVCYPLPIGLTPTCGNINAIELLTTASPDYIFQNFIQTFSPATIPNGGNRSPNPIMTFTGPGNSNTIQVNGLGQVLTISLNAGLSLLQDPFSVMTERFDPVAHTVSVVTLAGHPLAGWRYWRVYSIGTNDVVVETGAYDQPAPGIKNYWGFFATRSVLSFGWQNYLQYIMKALNAAPGSSLRGTLGGITLKTFWWPESLLGGYWDYFGDFTQYILNNVCQSTSCN